VYYPGLPEHPGHETAAKQMRRFGGMVSFRAAGSGRGPSEICNRARLFILAESLGGIESLIEHPGRMTHAAVVGLPPRRLSDRMNNGAVDLQFRSCLVGDRTPGAEPCRQ
jgi:cystathionine gamma-synthase